MRPTPDKMRAFLAQLKKKMNLKSLVVTLAAIVVFTTTYLLVLPAFTLDQEEAMEQGGIDFAAEETVETVDEEAPAEQAEEPAVDADAEASEESVTVEETVIQDEVQEEPAVEVTDAEKDKADDVKDAEEPKKEAVKETEKADEVKLLTKKTTLEAERAKGDDFTVFAEVGKSAKVPEDVTIVATELDKNTKGFQYEQRKQEALNALKKDSKDVKGIKSIKFYDISLESPSQDDSVEPADSVNVTIEFDNGVKVSDADNVRIVHFAEQKNGNVKAEVIDDSKVETTVNANSQMTETTFETEGFSEFAVVEVETIETTVITADGKTYEVSVTYGKDAGVPEGSRLEVSEITGANAKPYLEKAASTLKKDADDLSFAKFFDIKIMNGNDEVKIENPVNVEIKLLDNETLTDNTQVLHFESKEKADCVDSSVDGNIVKFEAEGFSVYAVVEPGSTGEYARMTVNFYNGDTLIDTMYVKNKDELDDLETILYDPGAGELTGREMFRGWTFNPNYTSADATSHYDPDTDPDGLMTIDDIRKWAAAKQITENEEVNIYAMIFTHYVVSYLDLPEYGTENADVSLGNSSIYLARTESEGEYKVSMPYSPHDGFHNFEGWRVIEGVDNIVSATYTDDEGNTTDVDVTKPIQNGTELVIKGDVTLRVNAPKGNWLVFDENAKGATYNAPQFLEADEEAVMPNPDAMLRTGYDFVGWFYNKDGTGEEFTGGTISERTTVYAKWTPKTVAPYKVLIYQQTTDSIGKESLGEDDYTLVNSVAVDNGIVGQNIPYTFHDNGAEDYVTVQGTDYHFTGFCFQQPTEQVEITADGKAVLKLYFNRIKYNLRFYLYWRRIGANGQPQGDYYFGNNSANGNNIFGVVNTHQTNNSSYVPTTTATSSYTPVTSTVRSGDTNYQATYFVLSAYYGEDISGVWPTYADITDGREGNNYYSPVSFVMMVGTKLKPQPNDTGAGTVKGIVQTMDENILGATNNVDGNFLVVRFQEYNNWTYHVYYETISGEEYDETVTCTYNGKTYYWDHDDTSRSSNTQPWSQNASNYEGFTPVVWRDTVTTGNNRHEAGKAYYEYLTTNVPIGSGGNYTGYEPELNYYYDRLSYQVNYHDGVYVDANNSVIESGEGRYLTDSFKAFEEKYPYDSIIPDNARNYDPTSLVDAAHQNEYEFEGWYFDQACEIPYTWGKMPIDGIKVYAKWRQKQYRVFLHPNVPKEDEEVDWGIEDQKMSFRISYGGTISTPEGLQDGYEMVGWYKDPECTQLYDDSTKLTDGTTSADYVKTRDWTDPMDEYGNIGENPTNSDADRFWVKRKMDLYGKWRQVMIGSKGINVIYDPNGGSGEPTDGTYYLDNAQAVAQPAPATPPTGKVFRYWVLQKWDPSANNDEGGFVDVEPLKDTVPGDTFTVLLANARRQEAAGHTEEDPKYTYTVQLRAEYGDPETLTPTHIDWYNNYVSDPQPPEYSNMGKEGKGLKINEAVAIYTPEEREGYVFAGWARVPVGVSHSRIENNQTVADLLNQSDIEDDYMYLYYIDGEYYLDANKTTKVTEVAADEETPYHDMYAIWEKKTYTVTVVKEVDGSEADKDAEFTISTSSDAGTPDPFATEASLKDFATHSTSKIVLENVPYETIITATENNYPAFEVAYSAVLQVTDDNGTVTDGAAVAKTNGGFKITGDTKIIVKNTRKTVDITINKVDGDGQPLNGAKFDLYNNDGDTPAKVSTVDMTNAATFKVEGITSGKYILRETKAPKGYVILETDVEFTVDASSNTKVIEVTSDNAQTSGDKKDVLIVTNIAGESLPMTGGIGTTIFYVLGSLLVVGCGITLVARKRMKSEEK